MMYVKMNTGPGTWSLYEAETVDWDRTYLQVPNPEQPDRDWHEFLAAKEVRCMPHLHVLTPWLPHCGCTSAKDPACSSPKHRVPFGDTAEEDCVKVLHRLDPKGEWWTHLYQASAYILGESGQTLEHL